MKEQIKKRIKMDLLVLGVSTGTVVGTAVYALSNRLPDDKSKAKTEKVADKKVDKEISPQKTKKFMKDSKRFSNALKQGDLFCIEEMIAEGFNINNACLRFERNQVDAISYLMFDLVTPDLGTGLASPRESGEYYKLGKAIKTTKMLVENGFNLTKYEELDEARRYARNPFCAIKYAQERVADLSWGEHEKEVQAELQDLYNYLSQARARQVEKYSQTQNNQTAQKNLLTDAGCTYQY